MKKIQTITAEIKNELYKEGFRFYAEGNYRTTKETDPWSGMPATTNDYYAFTNREEAEAFAEKQTWVFNPEVHADVYEIPAHTETWEEKEERREREKAERKAKRLAKERAKAEAEGLTLEQYKIKRAKEKAIKEAKAEIARLEEALKEEREYLRRLEA